MISNLETRPSLKFHDERDILATAVGMAIGIHQCLRVGLGVEVAVEGERVLSRAGD